MRSAEEEHLLHALAESPRDELAWLALADLREEQGNPSGQLLRLHLRLRQQGESRDEPAWREQLAALLEAEVRFDLPRRTNHLGMELALIPPGRFVMGSPEEEENREEDEVRHEVEITRAFWLGVDPVTVGQFRAFVQATGYHSQAEPGSGTMNWQNPGFRQDDNHPVVCVDWYEAQEFCTWLTKTNSGCLYRLPSEAEWEYACRAGAPESHPFHIGRPLRSLASTQANFDGNRPYGEATNGPFLKQTTQVRSYPASGWGLYDLHGNVWEWCADWYSEDYYQQSPRQDPPGPSEGSQRVFRGGGWNDAGHRCRSAYRDWLEPTIRNIYLGFRIALVPSGG